MRLDSVEVKVTIAGEGVGAAVDALGLPADRPEWGVYFCEDVARLTSPHTPLLDAGVILRARVRSPRKGDVTVKLRPGRRSQLTRKWLDAEDTDDTKFKIEADWAGQNKVLAVSYTADRLRDLISEVHGKTRSVSELLTDDQREFLAECADIHIKLDQLTLLGIISARRWDSLPAGPEALGIRAERWTLEGSAGRLDFLELSIAPPVDVAGAQQVEFEKFVRDQGLVPEAAQVPKTSRVLRALAALEVAR
jgi:hypothetical protein